MTLTKKEQRRVLYRLLGYLTYHKGILALALMLLALSSAGEVIGPLIIQRFLDHYVVPQHFIREEIIQLASVYIVIYLFAALVKYIEVFTF